MVSTLAGWRSSASPTGADPGTGTRRGRHRRPVCGRGADGGGGRGRTPTCSPSGARCPTLGGGSGRPRTSPKSSTCAAGSARLKGLAYALERPDEAGQILHQADPTSNPDHAGEGLRLMPPYTSPPPTPRWGRHRHPIGRAITLLEATFAMPAGNPDDLADPDLTLGCGGDPTDPRPWPCQRSYLILDSHPVHDRRVVLTGRWLLPAPLPVDAPLTGGGRDILPPTSVLLEGPRISPCRAARQQPGPLRSSRNPFLTMVGETPMIAGQLTAVGHGRRVPTHRPGYPPGSCRPPADSQASSPHAPPRRLPASAISPQTPKSAN